MFEKISPDRSRSGAAATAWASTSAVAPKTSAAGTRPSRNDSTSSPRTAPPASGQKRAPRTDHAVFDGDASRGDGGAGEVNGERHAATRRDGERDAAVRPNVMDEATRADGMHRELPIREHVLAQGRRRQELAVGEWLHRGVNMCMTLTFRRTPGCDARELPCNDKRADLNNEPEQRT